MRPTGQAVPDYFATRQDIGRNAGYETIWAKVRDDDYVLM
jgi:hypothetical protein